MADGTPPAVCYLRARRLAPGLAAITLGGPAAWLAADARVDIPQIGTGTMVSVAVLLLLPAPLAALTATLLHSAMADIEAAAARRLPVWEVGQLSAVGAFACLTMSLGFLVGGETTGALVAIRAYLLWLGVACLAGRLIGRQLAWGAPMALCLGFSLMIYDSTGAVRLWALSAHGGDSWTAWILAVSILAAGVWAAVLPAQSVPRWLQVARVRSRLLRP